MDCPGIRSFRCCDTTITDNPDDTINIEINDTDYDVLECNPTLNDGIHVICVDNGCNFKPISPIAHDVFLNVNAGDLIKFNPLENDQGICLDLETFNGVTFVRNTQIKNPDGSYFVIYDDNSILFNTNNAYGDLLVGDCEILEIPYEITDQCTNISSATIYIKIINESSNIKGLNCNNDRRAYKFDGNELFNISFDNTVITQTLLGDYGVNSVNALDYNAGDCCFYHMLRASGVNSLVKILSTDGVNITTSLFLTEAQLSPGEVVGPLNSIYNVAAIDSNNCLMLIINTVFPSGPTNYAAVVALPGYTNRLPGVNVGGVVPVRATGGGAPFSVDEIGADLVFYPNKNKFYGMNGNLTTTPGADTTLFEFSLDYDTFSTLGYVTMNLDNSEDLTFPGTFTNPPLPTSTGSMFGDISGELFIFGGNSGNFTFFSVNVNNFSQPALDNSLTLLEDNSLVATGDAGANTLISSTFTTPRLSLSSDGLILGGERNNCIVYTVGSGPIPIVVDAGVNLNIVDPFIGDLACLIVRFEVYTGNSISETLPAGFAVQITNSGCLETRKYTGTTTTQDWVDLLLSLQFTGTTQLSIEQEIEINLVSDRGVSSEIRKVFITTN